MKNPSRTNGFGSVGTRDREISGAGIGLRTCHIDRVLREQPSVPRFELLADNHLAPGGLVPAQIEALRDSYPVTLPWTRCRWTGPNATSRQHWKRRPAGRRRPHLPHSSRPAGP